MLFSTEEAKYLKTYLGDVVASESDADPQVLAEFMYALLQSDAPREVLLARCNEELSVFLEDKTNDIVKRVFSALDDKSYLPKESQLAPDTSSSLSETTTATKPDTSAQSATSRSYREDDEDEDDEDDDTNFKRRSYKSNTAPAEAINSSTGHSQKRSFQADDGSERGPTTKSSRQESPYGQHSSLQRLDGNRRPKKRCFDYDRKGYCTRGDSCPYEHGDDHLVMEANENGVLESVNNNNRTFGGPIRTRGRGGGFVGGRGGKDRSGSSNSNNKQEDVPYTSRCTPYSTKIVVENIPQDHCNIDSVTEFFGKFGKLVNLSVQADVSRAFLQYATHHEALAAYQSPAVIFNNRFVKVFWQKVDQEEERKEFMEQQRLASLPDPEAIKAKAAQLAKEKEERQKRLQENMKKVLEVQKQKQQLMEKQIEEHKILLERLKQAPPGSKEREDIMSAINHVSTLINSNNAPATTAGPSSNTATHHSSSLSPSSQQSVEKPIPPTTTTTLDAKKAEMEKLKAKLASLEAV
ncbi:hypothetical protein BCR42DRAFT_405793 [Absidia repens]|uniref:C3H1-type domain-containing protein n=1 Tax=Absidia repens TaxID=90262 RepID=A0A1X2IU16_9FUNG|nr:hypothetical protein BCR42DRAFT_405793 [Absidia repens]